MDEYKTVMGDTWDLIAKKVYGQENLMDYLMENNFTLLDYLIFPAGIAINVPELPETKKIDIPAWRK